jgi:hypothetical protein
MGLVTLVVCLVIQGVDVWSYTVHNITLDGPNTPLVFSSLPFFIQAPSTSHVNKGNQHKEVSKLLVISF